MQQTLYSPYRQHLGQLNAIARPPGPPTQLLWSDVTFGAMDGSHGSTTAAQLDGIGGCRFQS
jgi:hypothetical protein